MADYAVIQNGVVVNVIVAESLEIAEKFTEKTCVEFDPNTGQGGIGWRYNGEIFLPPESA